MNKPKDYLGDGVYAEFDRDMIRLSTYREDGEHVIYLELAVFSALERFADHVWELKR